MANISTYSLPQFTDLVDRSFIDGLDSLPQIMKNSGIVISGTKPMHTGEFTRFAERLHRNQYAAVRDEGAVSTQATIQYGYEKDAEQQTVSLEVSITKRMRVAGKDQDILDQVTNLSEVCPNTLDLDLAHRLTFAFATSYTNRDWDTVDVSTGDSLAVISDSHTLTGSATTYSNQITGNPQFSKGSLENAEQLFAEETYNNLWEKMEMMADTIITTDDPNSVNQVRELMNATADVSTDNSGTFNVYGNKYTHIVSGRIATTAAWAVDTSKRKYWFLACAKASDFNLEVLEAPYLKTPTDGNNGEEFSSENWNYLSASTYAMAIVTGRWIKWSQGNWA